MTAEYLLRSRPAFLITVDVEGDNLWARPRVITTNNAGYLPRFQTLCERHGLKPTWLTNWEMSHSPEFVDFATDAVRRGQAEIGMHLHAWHSPPEYALTDDDYAHTPYLTEYPRGMVDEKVRVLTERLEEVFGMKMVSHRAGRWGLNEVYARALAGFGYRADCSVTPNVSWKRDLGDPHGEGGPDYTFFPSQS
jgi:hypothetical protein